MAEPLLILANVGAEEGTVRDHAAVRAVARLWESLFTPAPAFEFLPSGANAAVAWLNTPETEMEAQAVGRTLAGAAPGIVARVHDKAFALEQTRLAGLLPAALEDTPTAFSPEALCAPDAIARLQQALDAWPAWARRSFTLKPRWGSSGRGRVAGRDGHADTEEIRGALLRLASRGGAILEPWLEGGTGLSASFWLEPEEPVRLVGTLDQLTDASGLFRGASGSVDSKGRIAAHGVRDAALREQAVALALAAQAAGYHGPLGVDALAFPTPTGRALRALELNARYTVGLVTIGLVRRQRKLLRRKLGLAPGALVHFVLHVAGSPVENDDVTSLRLAPDLGDPGPVLHLARTREALLPLGAPAE